MREKQVADKSAIKKLRQERKALIERAKNIIKNQNRIIKQISDQIAGEGRTVPEIAAATQLPTDRVLRYISGLKKYGLVVEAEKDGDYFRYRLAS